MFRKCISSFSKTTLKDMPLEGIICLNSTSYINIKFRDVGGTQYCLNQPSPFFFFFLPHHGASGLSVPQPGIRIPSPCCRSVGSNCWAPREVPVNLPSALARFLWCQATVSLPTQQVPRVCIIHPTPCVGNRKSQCSPIPSGTSERWGTLAGGWDEGRLWVKERDSSQRSAGDLKDGVPF